MGTEEQKQALNKKQSDFVKDIYGDGLSDKEIGVFKEILQKIKRDKANNSTSPK